jgi:CheY-like chemotaxis protein
VLLPTYFGGRAKGKGKPLAGSGQTANTVPADLDFAVLIVDDSEDSRYIYEHSFKHLGVRARSACDGEAALVSLLREPPDIIVLDLAMPTMTGWELLQHLKADPRTASIPVLVLSGKDERERAMVSGATAYCQKPCLPDALLSQIQRLLGRASKSSS